MAYRDLILEKAMQAQPDECLEWSGFRNQDGYGKVFIPGYGAMSIHRYVADQLIDYVEGLVVRHTCDRPACFNPHHLVVGTQQDNIRDMDEKGRRPLKVSHNDVLDIVVKYQDGALQQDLADEYGVTQHHISRIVNGVRRRKSVER